jgi:hypothetical protein
MDGGGGLGSAGKPCRARWVFRTRSRAAASTRPRPRWDRSSSPVYRPPTSIAAEDPARVSRVDRQINWTGRCRRTTDGDPRKRKNPGDDLFSRKAALSVSSALESLTSVFGMGTGMASPPVSPGFVASGCCSAASAAGPKAGVWISAGSRQRIAPSAVDLRNLSQGVDRSTMSQPLTPGQLL